MERAKRLHNAARKFSNVWFHAETPNGSITECAENGAELKFTLSRNEYETFLCDNAESALEALLECGNEQRDILRELVARVKRILVLNTIGCSVATETLSVVGAHLKADWFGQPRQVEPQFVCFATPIRIPMSQFEKMGRHSQAAQQFIRDFAGRDRSSWGPLCRGVLRVDNYVHFVYSLDGSKMAVISEFVGDWKSESGAVIVNLLDWLASSNAIHTEIRNDSSVPITLVALDKQNVEQHTTDYAEHLADACPKSDPYIQAWLRAREVGDYDNIPSKPADRHTSAVNLYLETTKILVEISQKKDVDDFYRQAAARIRLATIYEVDASVFRQLLVRSKPLVDSLTDQYSGTPEQRLYRAAQAAAPIPETRPFADMFIALSRPVRLDQYPDVTRRIFGQIRGRPTSHVWCEAVFITRDFPLLVFQAEPPHRELLSLWTDHWEGGDTLLPWALPWLIRLLDEHNQKVVAQQTGRVAYQTRAKKLRINAKTPPQYYAVTLRAHHLPPHAGGRASPRNTETDWHHRWHVQGHERALIRRGPLPLALTDRENLLRSGYQVFDTSYVDERCSVALERRGRSPLRHDEWLAIKYVRVDACVKPDRPDLPLVPSTRRVTGLTP